MQPTPSVTLNPAQQELVKTHLPLVYQVAGKYARIVPEEYEDLIGHLRHKLCEIVTRYDPASGWRPSTFINRSLCGELSHYFRDHAWIIKPPRSFRERSYSELIDGWGAPGDSQGEETEKLRSAMAPVSLDIMVTTADGFQEPMVNLIEDDRDVAAEVVNRVGGNEVVRAVYQALAPEDRLILALQTKRGPAETQEELHWRFKLTRPEAAAAHQELLERAQQLYLLQLQDEPLPAPTGNRVIREALWRKFMPGKGV